jgi:glycosyltransferase involved in cell wall biosynthesis
MKKILIVCDKQGWAFDAIAAALKKYAPGDIRVDVFFKKDRGDLKAIYADYDSIHFMHWSLVTLRKLPKYKKVMHKVFGAAPKFSEYAFTGDSPYIPRGMITTGIHGHHDFDDRKTSPEQDVLPSKNLIRYLSGFQRVNTVSQRLFRLFKGAGLNNMYCTQNGVDCSVFKPLRPLNESLKLRVGYAGTRKRDWKEGISHFIDPLREVDFIDLKLAIPQDNYIPHKDMPQFYNDIDVYLCASSSEGFSLSVLEASSCGRPIVSTRVGGSEELIMDGHNGFFVKQDLKDIIAKLRILHEDRELLIRMGRDNRQEIESKWSWKLRSQAWYDFLLGT